MKAVVRHSPLKKKLKIFDIPKPSISIKEKKALVKVHAVGVCGSDVENFYKKHKKKRSTLYSRT